MKYCSGVFTKLLNIVKSTFLLRPHRLFSTLQLLIFLVGCLLLSYLFSISYYALYCKYRFYHGLIEANKRNLWNTTDGVKRRFMPILMPACDRPHYLKRVLDGLYQVDGINETLVVVSQDCGLLSITSMLLSVPVYIRVLILPHTPPYFSLPGYFDTNEYATSANVKFLLEFAFEYMLADGAILLESDLIPSVDFYRYHQWTYHYLLAVNNSKVLSVHSFNLHSTNSSDPYSLFPRGFDSWGWSTARTRWSWLKRHWTKYNNWDITISRAAIRDQFTCMLPKLSRTRMIGLKGINVNVFKEFERKEFEETMYMSNHSIVYNEKQPKILPS